MRKSLLALLLVAVGGLAQAAVQLKDNHPERYTVVKGDTLWDISGRFLREPWKWPELWHANPQTAKSHGELSRSFDPWISEWGNPA